MVRRLRMADWQTVNKRVDRRTMAIAGFDEMILCAIFVGELRVEAAGVLEKIMIMMRTGESRTRWCHGFTREN